RPWGEVRWCSKASASIASSDQPQSQLSQVARVKGRRRAGHRVGAAGRLRQRDPLADVVAVGKQRDDPVKAERDPAVWGCAEAERLEEESEPCLRLALVDSDQLEDPLLDVDPVVTYRPAAELVAGAHKM